MTRRDVAWTFAGAILFAAALGGGCGDAPPSPDDPRGWVAVLRRSDVYGQKRAVEALARIGDPAVPGLRDALGDPRLDTRLAAVRTLARLGPAAAPALGVALRDGDPVVRSEACDALVAIGPASAGEMRGALDAPNHAMRESAVRCAGRLGAAGAVVLPGALVDGDGRVRDRAIEAALAIGPPALPALEEVRAKVPPSERSDVERVIAEIRGRDGSKPAT